MSQDSKQDPSHKQPSSLLNQDFAAANNATGEHLFTVVKRSGAIVPFRRKRIDAALEAAFRDTKNIPQHDSLPEELAQALSEMSDYVVTEALKLAAKNVSLTVEGIQDLVEVTLMKKGHHDVARDYIIYRDKHKELRQDDPRQLKVLRGPGQQPVRFSPIKVSRTIEKIFYKQTQAGLLSLTREAHIAAVAARNKPRPCPADRSPR